MKRLALPLAAAALALVALAGCSKTDTASTSTTQAQAQSNGNSGNNSSSSISVPGGVTVPGGGDINKIAADAQKCGEASAGYAGLYTPLMSGSASDADKQKVTDALNKLKADAPANIQADLDTIANGIKNAKSFADLGTFLSSDAYTKANNEVTNYLASACSKVGQ